MDETVKMETVSTSLSYYQVRIKSVAYIFLTVILLYHSQLTEDVHKITN